MNSKLNSLNDSNRSLALLALKHSFHSYATISEQTWAALTGQLLIALVATHFGWFNLPITTINHTKLLGAVLLIGGMIFIN